MSQNAINNKIGSANNTNPLTIEKSATGQLVDINTQAHTSGIYNGTGSPEGIITANKGSVYLDNDSGDVYKKTEDGTDTGWEELASSSIPIVQKLTTSGTYTPTSGMLYCVIEVIGGGGGGGHASAPVTYPTASGAGGGGGYAKGLFTASQIGASQTVVVGSGGTGGTSGVPDGANGTLTSVGSLVSATGGFGGKWGQTNSTWGEGGVGGIGTGGFFQSHGSPGTNGSSYIDTSGGSPLSDFAHGGTGGSSYFGGGAVSVVGINGQDGKSAGGGGGGSGQALSLPALDGGNGAAGVVIITEYLSQGVASGSGQGLTVQTTETEKSTVLQTTQTLPVTDTIPQITQGTQYMTHVHTPLSSSNILQVDFIGFGDAVSTTNTYVALFRQGVSNALTTTAAVGASASPPTACFNISTRTTAGTTSPITFEARFGGGSGEAVSLGGTSGGNLWGTSGKCMLRVTEYLPNGSIAPITEPVVAFEAKLEVDDVNVTGDGTLYTLGSVNPLTVIQSGTAMGTDGVFTAPYDGWYTFSGQFDFSGLTAAMTNGQMVFLVNGTLYEWGCNFNPYAVRNLTGANGAAWSSSRIFKLTTGSTVQALLQILGGTKVVTVKSFGAPSQYPSFSGALIRRT